VSYDPRKFGALCDMCPLKGNVPVPAESNPGATICMVGEAPGADEVREGRPFVGANGQELQRALNSARLQRRDLHLTNVMLCQPPKNELDNLLAKVSSDNKERTKRNQMKKKQYEVLVRHQPWLAEPEYEALVPTPIECCSPRLKNEVQRFTNYITLGGTASKVIMNTTMNILGLRGGMAELEATKGLPARRVLPTVHPSFVLRAPRWSHVFRNDLHRASRWFRGGLNWVTPNITYHPTAAWLESFLNTPGVPYWTYDLETDGIEPLTAKIRCVGIGSPDGQVALVGLLSKDGISRFYTGAEEQRVIAVMKHFFTDPTKMKVGHNSGSYDSNCLQAQWGIWPEPALDTIMLHRLVESELPHSLGFVGSMYTDAPSWKTDREGRKIAFDAESDEQLHEYCGMDVAVTARVVPPLFDSVKARGQMDLVGLDHQVQRICAEMHMVGMWVDQDKRLYFEKKYITEVGKRLEDLRVSAPTADFNPGSPHQIRKILFNQWGLVSPLDERDRYTASGDPATSDDVLRSLLTLQHLTDEQRNFVLKLRRYRKAQKLLGTYVVKLRPSSMQAELGWDDDEDFEDAEMRKKYSLERTGIVDLRTGRMHPGYNAHVAVTGRLSSSKPINAQNFPKGLRAMVTAAPGNVLIGADADQLELRIAAALWGAKRYLRAFDASADPHSSTALACFPERFKQAEGFPGGRWDGDLFIPDGTGKWSGQAKTFRDLAKRVQYASQYMATVETVHRVICQTETENGDGTTSLPYLHLSLREVREMHQAWLDGCPEFPQGWEREVGEWRKQTYLVEPITGRRRDFLDGENPNELVNFKIQGGAAGLMNKAIVELANRVPVFKWGLGTGIINQCHDALVLEVPMDTAELRKKNNPDTGKEESFWHVPEDSIPGRMMQELNECMNQVHPALPGVKITAAADIGLSWKEVG
jgi:DNA polymerase I-like protein with 3'-5' exonuclease and polymerase domains/uracil-DNA glycosylase